MNNQLARRERHGYLKKVGQASTQSRYIFGGWIYPRPDEFNFFGEESEMLAKKECCSYHCLKREVKQQSDSASVRDFEMTYRNVHTEPSLASIKPTFIAPGQR